MNASMTNTMAETKSGDCQKCNSCSSNDRFATPDLGPVNRVAQFQGAIKPFPLLLDVMAYSNLSVVYRLVKKDGYSSDEASAIFDDVKRFLYLAGTTTQPIAPTKRIDDGWHTFILHTLDYTKFCDQFFGRYIHHLPNPPGVPKGDSSMLRRTRELARAMFATVSENWSICPTSYSPPEGCVETDDSRRKMAPVASEDCAPVSNGETPPSDCAVNHREFPGVLLETAPTVSAKMWT